MKDLWFKLVVASGVLVGVLGTGYGLYAGLDTRLIVVEQQTLAYKVMLDAHGLRVQRIETKLDDIINRLSRIEGKLEP